MEPEHEHGTLSCKHLSIYLSLSHSIHTMAWPQANRHDSPDQNDRNAQEHQVGDDFEEDIEQPPFDEDATNEELREASINNSQITETFMTMLTNCEISDSNLPSA
jgi:hypothetical protein